MPGAVPVFLTHWSPSGVPVAVAVTAGIPLSAFPSEGAEVRGVLCLPEATFSVTVLPCLTQEGKAKEGTHSLTDQRRHQLPGERRSRKDVLASRSLEGPRGTVVPSLQATAIHN